ncbi:MAG: TorF family putative porin, partial [Pseudomonadota bacterium]
MKATTRLASLAVLLLSAVTASAQWSANVGWSSEYIFRGIQQKTSSASAGLDFEQGGFYAGTWAADVGDGLEVDGYFGFGGGTDTISYSVGFTGYYYTGDFDDTYQEINLGLAGGIFSVDVAVGEYENFSGPTQDYTFWSVSAEKDGFYGTLGGFAQDFEGEYL